MMMSTQFPGMKHSGLRLQDQDSTSTQSTEESSGGEVASFEERNRYGCSIVNTNLSGPNKLTDFSTLVSSIVENR